MSEPPKPKPVVVDTWRSPHARLRPVPVSAVRFDDTFWAPRRRINHQATLPQQFEQLESSHRLDNFRRVSGKVDRPFEGPIFNDTDVYKWLEAAAWTLATEDDPALERMVDVAIGELEAAQQPNGYLHSYFWGDKESERWTNLRDLHEMYNAGHLIQAGVAHYRATGSTRLLQVARRFADHICQTFGPEQDGKRAEADGHEEVELALVELARATGDDTYLKQAQFFIDVRGRGAVGGRSYHQDHVPFRELDEMIGHAVRAVYYTSGATDVLLESGEQALRDALDWQWNNMVTRRMYVSGGIGARHEGEAFGKDFELPNERAYTETCAAIGSLMWNWRMLALTGDARYADVLELALYNGVLSGLSLDGKEYFYDNPLESDGTHRRTPWFGCACCPPNVARTLASLPGYVYSVANQGVWAHLYVAGEAELELPDGNVVRLKQRSDYPWDGSVTFEVNGEGSWSLFLRIPAWCEGASLTVNGTAFAGELTPGSYAELKRDWRPGDSVKLELPMPVRAIGCHPYVWENRGRVALMRGPLLFCVEQADNPDIDPRDLVLPATPSWNVEHRPDLLGGVTVLSGPATAREPAPEWNVPLYRVNPPSSVAAGRAVRVTAIPYYAWANRQPGRMQVWLRAEDA